MSKTFRVFLILGLVLLVAMSLATAALAAPPVKVSPSGTISSLSVSPSHVAQGGSISVSITFAGVSDNPNGVHIIVQGPGGNGSNRANGQVGYAGSVVKNITIPSDANPGAWRVTEVIILGFDGNQYSPTQLSITSFPDGAFTVDPPDITPPIVTATLSPAPNGAGWNNTSVTITWSATDPESGIASGPTPASQVVSTEGAGQIFSATATNGAGLVGTGSVILNIDKTAPTITASATKADGTAYVAGFWTNQDVTVHYTASDLGGSGLASVTGDQTFSATTASTSGTATDNAGNSTSVSFGLINIDKIPPTIVASISPASPAATGWYNMATGAPTVSFAVNDTGGSGLAGPGPAPVTLGNGAGQSVSGGPIYDVAGNASGVDTISGINVDLIAPAITASATKADGSAYAAGSWTNQNVTVHYVGSDTGGSGLASVTGDQTFSATTASVSGTATDGAGNSTSVSFGPINIDKIPPTVTITGPSVVLQGTSASAAWVASDTGGSGLATPAAGTLPLNTTAAGTFTVTTTAKDNAGNLTIASFTYTVWGVNGPYAPLVKSGKGVGQFKAGSTIPVKFQLTDGTNLITTAAGTVTIGGASAPIRWDATAQQYIANVKTAAPGTGVSVVLTVNGLTGSYQLSTVDLR